MFWNILSRQFLFLSSIFKLYWETFFLSIKLYLTIDTIHGLNQTSYVSFIIFLPQFHEQNNYLTLSCKFHPVSYINFKHVSVRSQTLKNRRYNFSIYKIYCDFQNRIMFNRWQDIDFLTCKHSIIIRSYCL